MTWRAPAPHEVVMVEPAPGRGVGIATVDTAFSITRLAVFRCGTWGTFTVYESFNTCDIMRVTFSDVEAWRDTHHIAKRLHTKMLEDLEALTHI